MKRSEAIEYIIQLLGREGISSSYNLTSDVDIAEEILTLMEEIGMLPPIIRVMPNGTIAGSYETMEWEDKDENS